MTYTMSVPTQQQFTLPYTNRDHSHSHTHHQAEYITPRSLPQEQENNYSLPQQQSIAHLSVSLDATVLSSWHDTSEYSISSSSTTYYCMDLLISSFPSPENRVLARYTGGRLKKDALYQLRGRFFLDQGGEKEKSYFHVDEAVRFQGPGVLRSFRVPRFTVVGMLGGPGKFGSEGVVVKGRGRKMMVTVTVRWSTRDPYRRDLVYEQSVVLRLEEPVLEQAQGVVGRECVVEGRMEGFDKEGGWVCDSVSLC